MYVPMNAVKNMISVPRNSHIPNLELGMGMPIFTGEGDCGWSKVECDMAIVFLVSRMMAPVRADYCNNRKWSQVKANNNNGKYNSEASSKPRAVFSDSCRMNRTAHRQ